MSQQKTIYMSVDNRAADTIARTILSGASDYCHHKMLYLKDFIKRKELQLNVVKWEANVADIFTKLVRNRLFYEFRDAPCLVNNHKRSSGRLKEKSENRRQNATPAVDAATE